MAGFGSHGSIKDGEFLDQLSNYPLLRTQLQGVSYHLCEAFN
jgi:hypothetical protein